MRRSLINNNIGSVSSCTMRPEDLIPSFLWEVRRQKRTVPGHRRECRAIEARSNKDGYFESEDCHFDLESLFDMLDAYAPMYFYFGAHPGDGADYGYWLSESFEEDFDGLKVSDLSEVPNTYSGEVLLVNDHGNMSLYVARARKRKPVELSEVWAIV